MTKILVVEEDSDDAMLIGLALNEMGLEMIANSSGHDLVRQIKEECPDCVILDPHLPCLDGLELLLLIRKNGFRRIPAIIFSGSDHCKSDARVKEADRFLLKPVDSDLLELREAIKEVVVG